MDIDLVVSALCSGVCLLHWNVLKIIISWEKSFEGFVTLSGFHFFLGSTLKVNPEERLSITELVNQLQEIAAARNVNPKSPITEVKCLRSIIDETSFLSSAVYVHFVKDFRAGPLFVHILKILH